MPWKKVEPVNQRKEFAMRAIEASNFRELCQEYRISPKTGYKWRQRFLEHGLAGMNELSRRPKSRADELKEGVVCEIVKLRRAHPTGGGGQVRQRYEGGGKEGAPQNKVKRGIKKRGFVGAPPPP